VSDSPSLPLLLLLDIASEQTFLDILAEVIKKEVDAEKDAVPMDTLLDHIKPEGPLFRVRFFDSTQAAETSHASTSLHTDLTLFLLSKTPAATGPATRAAPIPSQLQLRLSYNSLLFTSSRIHSLLSSLTQLLEVASTAPTTTPLGVLPLRTESQASVLPDPTADLDWCGFKGAIPDIFSANARAHPDRACVVESVLEEGQNVLDGPSRERKTFTYKQIDEASNVLGHALLKSGLERGEVVMVYAARSVELVVCVMGVLKAGGVFSVIGESLSMLC
jgi:L-aminoadipate-semialdehyde dehydrogenase